MTRKQEQVLPIAELLPEGLSEAAIAEIANLVGNVIEEQVAEKVQELEAKVKGYIRMRVDDLKDQALRELQEENAMVRSAKLFESVKTLMALEISTEDEENVISDLVNEQSNFEEEIEVLTEELRKSFNENDRMDTIVKSLSRQVKKLEENNDDLASTVETLEESKEKPFKSSEKAVVITENVDTKVEKREVYDNRFLTSEVMKFMPSNPNPNSKI